MGDPIRHSTWFYWRDWHRYVGVSHDHVAPSPLQMAADLGMNGAQVMAWLDTKRTLEVEA